MPHLSLTIWEVLHRHKIYSSQMQGLSNIYICVSLVPTNDLWPYLMYSGN